MKTVLTYVQENASKGELSHSPPWYGTALAHITYLVIVLLALVLVVRRIYLGLKMKKELLEDPEINLAEDKIGPRRLYVKLGPDVWKGKSISRQDEDFLQKLEKVLSRNLFDPDFNVEGLHFEMNISREHLYRKLKSLIGESPSGLIRSLRLKMAADMLKEEGESITRVSMNCGFSNSSIFARRFRIFYGMTPGQYRKQHRIPAEN